MMGKNYILTMDIKKANLKKGMIFKWNVEENCYTTDDLPWMFSPLIDWKQFSSLKRKGILKEE